MPTADAAERIAAVVTAVPGVAGLHAGPFGEVATYLPGQRVAGVRVGEQGCEVHVVATAGTPLLQVADRVRAAATAATGGRVDVIIEDIALSSEGLTP